MQASSCREISLVAEASSRRLGGLPGPRDAVRVYPPAVSDKPPQTYILHTVALFVVLIVVMVLFLKHQWG